MEPRQTIYKAGGRASAIYAAPGTPDLPGQAALAATYIAQLKKAAAALLGPGAASLVPLAYNGDLNWYWTDGISFNAATYSYISGAIAPSPGSAGLYQVGGAGSFGNLYQELINGIVWQLSPADADAIQEAVTRGETQATAIVAAYVATFGAPTPAQMQAAKALNPLIATPLDYVLLHAAGYLWAGRPLPPLSLTAMRNAPDLPALLQYAPPSAQPTVQAISPYLGTLGIGATLMDRQSLGGFILSQIKANLGAPSAMNGGMQLFNPPSASYYLGYSSSVSPAEILQELGSPGRAVTIAFSAAPAPSSGYTISFPGEAGIAWAGDLLDISAGPSFRGDVAAQAGAGSAMTVTPAYPGVTIVPFLPAAWQQTPAGSSGWWHAPIIDQAWANFQAGPKAPSGFTFVNGVPSRIRLGQDGLGYLSAVVLAGNPTVTIEFPGRSYGQFSSWLSTPANLSISLFGFIPLGSPAADPYMASASPSGAGFALRLAPSTPGSLGPIVSTADETMPVLAGQVSWAGAT
jgi:hypothetical protein